MVVRILLIALFAQFALFGGKAGIARGNRRSDSGNDCACGT